MKIKPLGVILLVAIVGCDTQAQKLSERDKQIKAVFNELIEEDPQLRSGAAKKIGLDKSNTKGYIESIAKLLKDKNAGIRICAIETLAELQAKQYVKDIADLLNDKEYYSGPGFYRPISIPIRRRAAESLKKLGVKEYQEKIEYIIKHTLEDSGGGMAPD